MRMETWMRRGAALMVAALLLLGSGRDLMWGGPEEETAAPALAEQSPEEPKLIALTFDDGPLSTTTEALLDGLAQRGVPATFFVLGFRVKGLEHLVARMAEEGHQVGVHAYDHVPLLGLGPAALEAQVGRTRRQLSAILGEDTYYLRPPFGFIDDGVRRGAGAPIILWSVDPEDWRQDDPAAQCARIVSQAEDGAIILMHDLFPTSVEAALLAVDALLAQGYYFVTVHTLLAARGVTAAPGQPYYCAPSRVQ